MNANEWRCWFSGLRVELSVTVVDVDAVVVRRVAVAVAHIEDVSHMNVLILAIKINGSESLIEGRHGLYALNSIYPSSILILEYYFLHILYIYSLRLT